MSDTHYRKRVEALQQRFNEETRGAKLELVLFQVRPLSCSTHHSHTADSPSCMRSKST